MRKETLVDAYLEADVPLEPGLPTTPVPAGVGSDFDGFAKLPMDEIQRRACAVSLPAEVIASARVILTKPKSKPSAPGM